MADERAQEGADAEGGPLAAAIALIVKSTQDRHFLFY